MRPSRGPGIARNEAAPLPGQGTSNQPTSPRGQQGPQLVANNPSLIAQKLQSSIPHSHSLFSLLTPILVEISNPGAPRQSQQQQVPNLHCLI